MRKMLLVILGFIVFSSKAAEFKDFSEENKKHVLGYFRALLKCTYGSQEQCEKAENIERLQLPEKTKDIQDYAKDLKRILFYNSTRYSHLEKHKCTGNFIQKTMQLVCSKQKSTDYNRDEEIDRISDKAFIMVLEANERLKKEEWVAKGIFSYTNLLVYAYGPHEASKIPLRWNIINGALGELIKYSGMRGDFGVLNYRFYHIV